MTVVATPDCTKNNIHLPTMEITQSPLCQSHCMKSVFNISKPTLPQLYSKQKQKHRPRRQWVFALYFRLILHFSFPARPAVIYKQENSLEKITFCERGWRKFLYRRKDFFSFLESGKSCKKM